MREEPKHLTLDFSPQGSLRHFYEVRYAVKRKGEIERLHFYHLADNYSLARRIKVYLNESRSKVLDVGAGAADVCVALGCDETIQLDISIEILQSRPTGRGVAKICGIAENLPVASGTVDIVVATQVLEHVPNYQQAIKEFARVLAPSGILFIAVPSHYEYMRKLFHRVSREIDSSGHLRAFHPQLLADELTGEFEVICTRQTGYAVFWFFMALERSGTGSHLTRVLNNLFGQRSARMLSRILDAENAFWKKMGGGMSYEIVAVRK